MANQESRRDERESTAKAASGQGERGLATRQYQDPFAILDSVFDRMQRDLFGTSLFNAMLPTRAEGEAGGARVPRMQIKDSGDAIDLTAEMPGIKPENVRVELEGDVLTLSGEAGSEEEREGARTGRYVSFYRQMMLPEAVDPERAQASYKHGVLSIRLPKRAQHSRARQIPVNTEQATEPGGQPATRPQTSGPTRDKAA